MLRECIQGSIVCCIVKNDEEEQKLACLLLCIPGILIDAYFSA